MQDRAIDIPSTNGYIYMHTYIYTHSHIHALDRSYRDALLDPAVAAVEGGDGGLALVKVAAAQHLQWRAGVVCRRAYEHTITHAYISMYNYTNMHV